MSNKGDQRWHGAERRKSFGSGVPNEPADSPATVDAANAKPADASEPECIHRLRNIGGAGSIFTVIGNVLASHHGRIDQLERQVNRHIWERVKVRHGEAHQHPIDEVCSRCPPGKFRKLIAACGTIARLIKNFFIKK